MFEGEVRGHEGQPRRWFTLRTVRGLGGSTCMGYAARA